MFFLAFKHKCTSSAGIPQPQKKTKKIAEKKSIQQAAYGQASKRRHYTFNFVKGASLKLFQTQQTCLLNYVPLFDIQNQSYCWPQITYLYMGRNSHKTFYRPGHNSYAK